MTEPPSLEVYRSTFTENQSEARAGALLSHEGRLKVHDCTFQKNLSGSEGGALVLHGGEVTIEQSVFGANRSGTFGGATGKAYVLNSTLAYNDAHRGAAAFVSTSGRDLILNHVTVSANTAELEGGGIYDGGRVEMMHSIIASNRAPSGPDVFASSEAVETLSLSTNLFGSLQDSGLPPGGTDLLGVDPMLEPLEDNGGPTPTTALLPGSPAIDAIPPEACLGADDEPLTADQRGEARPAGSACDVGAFELQ